MKTKKKSKKKTVIENPEYKDVVGKSSLLRIDWKSWDELPDTYAAIFAIIKFDDGYLPVGGQYMPGAGYPKFDVSDDFGYSLYLDDPLDKKRLIAWGEIKVINKVVEECIICKELQCRC